MIGYSFQNVVYCPDCIRQAMTTRDARFEGWAMAKGVRIGYPDVKDRAVEDYLSEIAEAFGYDRSDEASFDERCFPKVVTSSDLEEQAAAPDDLTRERWYDDSCGYCCRLLGSSESLPTVNADLLRSTIKAIEADPEHWDQETWADVPKDDPLCGTTMCFAGWAVFTAWGAERFLQEAVSSASELVVEWSDLTPRTKVRLRLTADIPYEAEKLLGLVHGQAVDLFYWYEPVDLTALKERVTRVTGVTVE